MLLLIYAFFWFIMYLLVIGIAYLQTGAFLAIIFRAEKFRKEGRKLLGGLISLAAMALNIVILQLICIITDNPHLFYYKHFNPTTYLLAAVYAIIIRALAKPYIKIDAPELLNRGKRKK